MAKEKDLTKLTLDQLAELRAGYDNQMKAIREKKLEIQAEVDRRYEAEQEAKKAAHVVGGKS